MYNTTTKQRFLILLQKEIFSYLLSPITYLGFLFVCLISSINFFVVNNFFSSTGSTNLETFFSVFPFISIIYIPILFFSHTDNDSFLDLVPIHDFLKTVIKFLSCFIITICTFALTIIIPIIIQLFGTIQLSKLFLSYFFIFLYSGMLISICLLFSSIVKNKYISLLLSVLLFLLLSILQLLPSILNSNNKILVFVCHLFSFSWHFSSATKGIFSINDLLFFSSLILLFLYSTYILTLKNTGYKNTKNSILIFICILLSFIDINFITKQFDFTKSKENSLSTYSQNLLDIITEPINITYVVSEQLTINNSHPKEILNLLEIYKQRSSLITIKYLSPDNNQDIQDKLQTLGIQPQIIENQTDSTNITSQVYSCILIETKNNTNIIPFVISTNGLEYLLTLNILSLQTNKQISVLIKMGNNLSLENNYPYLQPWLISSGILPIFINSCSEIDNYNNSIPLLLLGCSQLTETDCYLIENTFINKRPLLLCISSNDIEIETTWAITKKQTKFLSMLNKWGINISNELVMDTNCFNLILQDQNFSSNSTSIKYPFWINTDKGYFYWPNYISLLNKNLFSEVIASSSNESFLTNDVNTNPFDINTNQRLQTKNQQYPLAQTISGDFSLAFHDYTINNRVVIFSDQYYLSKMIDYTNSILNLSTITDVILTELNLSKLIEIKNKTQFDYSLNKINSNYTLYRNYVLLFLLIYPILIILVFVFVLKFSRKLKKINLKLQN